MATRVLLRDRPNRALALATPSHALVFRHSSQAAANPSASSTSLLQQQQQQQQQAPGTTTAAQTSNTTNASSSNSISISTTQKCIVELVPAHAPLLKEYRPVVASVHGTLGMITLDNDVFLCVVSAAARVAVVRPGETVRKILGVNFLCLNRAEWDHTFEDLAAMAPDMVDEDGFEMDGRRDTSVEHPCLQLGKLLSGGSFYYSADFDLTSRLQERPTDAASFDFDSFDTSYLWNSYMIQPLVDFRNRLSSEERKILDSNRLLTSAIRGFAHTIDIPAQASPARPVKAGLPSTLTLISRLSCRRAGTRFNARGIDDEGQVANFVETETVFWTPSGVCVSYAQIRGSIPIFWEQTAGLLPGQQKIQITRSAQATQPAFDKHFEELEVKYGPIHVINLLSKERSGEVDLSRRFHDHILHSSLNNRQTLDATTEHKFLRETDYDFHAETRTGYEAAVGIVDYIRNSAEGFMCCVLEAFDEKAAEGLGDAPTKPSTLILQQTGAFRTNCLDCLDRTNLVQTIISQLALEIWLDPRGERLSAEFKVHHGTLWADNGDALSHIYAGTGALKSSFTRHGKMSLAGALSDVRKSAQRAYINNFADKGRQSIMDILLGRMIGQTPVYLFDPINDYMMNELNRRSAEFTSSKEITIWAGTYNLNGKTEGLNDNLSPWLCPPVAQEYKFPHIVAVGFQEIVELSPQHIMSTEPTRRQAWEKAVRATLNENAITHDADKYVLLRGGQLVGASLSIFVKSSILSHIKNVEGSLKKTGLSGVAGNKGAVAIRMEIYNTSLCFVTAHLAAGFANYDERNRDYKTISYGLRFQRNRSIDDHDTVIWLGDFNYRIGLSNEKAKQYAKAGDLEQLYLNDQLNIQMVKGLAFPFYSEARITFMPTYKYDVGTDTFDTSEKARIPAWTDRILRKGSNIRQINYDSAPLRFSDHRPVYATFECTVNVVDQKLKGNLSREIYNQRRAAVEGSLEKRSLNGGDETDEEDLIGYDPIEPSLPPASSDRRKWWLDNGLPARSTVQPPGPGYIANPDRPSNPFVPSDQPDWKLASPQAAVRNSSQQSLQSIASTSSRQSSAGQTPRQVSAQSTQSNQSIPKSVPEVLRKPTNGPPPIPRKPAALNSPKTVSDTTTTPTSPTPSGQSTASPSESNFQAPPLPTRRTLPIPISDEQPPEKPPRPVAAEALPGPEKPAVASTGLMDESDDEGNQLVGYAPLKPQ